MDIGEYHPIKKRLQERRNYIANHGWLAKKNWTIMQTWRLHLHLNDGTVAGMREE
jgi:carbamoylphosphate synthase small subunit